MLEVDEISAKTLPHLDKIYREAAPGEGLNKLVTLLKSSNEEALKRLTKAAVARIRTAASKQRPENNHAFLLEQLIDSNHKSDMHTIDSIIEELNGGLHVLLALAVVRFNIIG